MAILQDKNILDTVSVQGPEVLTVRNFDLQTQSITQQPQIVPQPVATNVTTPKPFGNYSSDKYAPINDSVQIDVYSSSDLFLESILRATTYTINGSTLSLDLEAELQNAQYLAGDFNITSKLLRNLLGSSDGQKVLIQDISADRLEVRVRPAQLIGLDQSTLNQYNQQFQDWFKSGFFELDKQSILTNLFLYSSTTEQTAVFDYIQDRITFESEPWSIIFRLTSPLPSSVNIDDAVWFAQQVALPIQERVRITPPKQQQKYTRIKGPNYDATIQGSSAKSTEYKDWDDLLGSTNQRQIASSLFSGSFLEGVDLPIDYRKFENFAHFGSVTERIKNFEYKVKLLEYYDGIVSSLGSSLNGLVSGSSSGSYIFVSQSAAYSQKKQALIGTFDPFERYMYYESSSFVSNSFGEFLDIAWPKSNSTKPYTLMSSNDPYIESWMEGVMSSASLYDQQNDNLLVKFIPSHIRESEGNESAETLVHMLAHYYDIVYSYIKNLNKIYDRNESLNEGFSKDLIYHVAQNLGVDFENGNSLDSLWSYTLGLDSEGVYNNALSISSEDRTKEIWKRIINNLPYLLKTKGTARGVRALINCFGIPQTILRIREYGGPEPEFNTATNAEYERFNYALNIGVTGSSFGAIYGTDEYGTGSFGIAKTGLSYITTPWLTESRAIELRFKPVQDYKTTQTLFEIPDRFKVVLNTGSQDTVGFYVKGASGTWSGSYSTSSLYDNAFTHLAINASMSGNNITYTLYTKKTNYGKVTQTYSSSFTTTTADFTSSWLSNNTTIWLPGSGSTGLFSGSVQEFRFWNTSLHEDVIDNHALAPTSFQGNTDEIFTGSTSSFDSLLLRLTLGSDNKKTDYHLITTESSKHPNQNETRLAYFNNFVPTDYTNVVETNYLEWPDTGGNRQLGNKVRIEETFNTSDQLFRDNKTQRSVSDNYPTDSPRLGIFLSPTNEVNQDIAEQFGGLSLDDFIGDPRDTYNNSYDALDDLRRAYFKKYTNKNNAQNYINLLRYYDSSLFNIIKSFVPLRANLQTGLVVESDVLHRNKFAIEKPTTEELQYESELVVEDSYTIGGSIQDADGDHRDGVGYVPDAVITEELITPVAEYFAEADGTISKPLVDLYAKQNEFNTTQVEEQGAGVNSLTDTIDLGISGYGRDTRVQGSQYRFKTWALSGSQWILIDSIGEDYYNPIQPIISGSRPSLNYDITEFPYNGGDILYGSGSFPVSSDVYFTGSVLSTSLPYYGDFGFRFTKDIPVISLTSRWYITYTSQSLQLDYGYNGGSTFTHSFSASLLIPSKSYSVSFTVNPSIGEDPLYIQVAFGSNKSTPMLMESGSTTTFSINETGVCNNSGLSVYVYPTGSSAATGGTIRIDNLTIKQTSAEKAEVQDFQVGEFASVGMKNARYDGCKLIASDYNVNSNDTVDGGPVITITQTDSNELIVDPTKRGTFRVQ